MFLYIFHFKSTNFTLKTIVKRYIFFKFMYIFIVQKLKIKLTELIQTHLKTVNSDIIIL